MAERPMEPFSANENGTAILLWFALGFTALIAAIYGICRILRVDQTHGIFGFWTAILVVATLAALSLGDFLAVVVWGVFTWICVMCWRGWWRNEKEKARLRDKT